MATDSGWPDGWHLLETPEARRHDVQLKLVSIVNAIVLVVWIVLVSRTYWDINWPRPLVISAVPVFAYAGVALAPPAWPTWIGLWRFAPLIFAPDLGLFLAAIGLWGIDTTEVILMKREVVLRTSGLMPTARHARKARVDGLRLNRERRYAKFMN